MTSYPSRSSSVARTSRMTSSSSTTRRRSGLLMTTRVRQRQRDPRLRAAALARRRGRFAAVAPHDVARDGEAEARSARLLGREERLEELPRRPPAARPRPRSAITTRAELPSRAERGRRRRRPRARRRARWSRRFTKTCSSSRGSPTTTSGPLSPSVSRRGARAPKVVSTDSAALASTSRRSVADAARGARAARTRAGC